MQQSIHTWLGSAFIIVVGFSASLIMLNVARGEHTTIVSTLNVSGVTDVLMDLAK